MYSWFYLINLSSVEQIVYLKIITSVTPPNAQNLLFSVIHELAGPEGSLARRLVVKLLVG